MSGEEYRPTVYFESQSHAVVREALFDILRMWTNLEGRSVAYRVNSSMQATFAPEAPLVAYNPLASPRINLRRQMEVLKLHWESIEVQYEASYTQYRTSLAKYRDAGSLELMNSYHDEIQKNGSRTRELEVHVTHYKELYNMMDLWHAYIKPDDLWKIEWDAKTLKIEG